MSEALAAAAPALLKLVDADDPPLRLLLGAAPTEMVKQIYAGRLATWADCDDVSKAAQGTEQPLSRDQAAAGRLLG